MNGLIFKNKIETIVVRLVELNGFQYSIDSVGRVRFSAYVGMSIPATTEAIECHRNLQRDTIAYIRENIKSILKTMNEELDECNRTTVFNNEFLCGA